jgi:hypothetical protein
MPRLSLSDRTFEDNDGIWTTMEFHYCHPWENGEEADIAVSIKTFERQEGGGFDFDKPPANRMFFYLHEMETVMLWGFLAAAKDLMPRQWAEYRAQMAEEAARKQDKAAA